MTLRWRKADGGWQGYDADERVVAQVVRSDASPLGPHHANALRSAVAIGRWWVAFLGEHRLAGRWATPDEAKAAGDRAVG